MLLTVFQTEEVFQRNVQVLEDTRPRFYPGGGYFHIRRSGGLDLASSLEAKFGARFSQVHQIRGKIWGVLSLQDAKIGKESQFWGHLGLYLKFKGQNLGYLSPIFLEAKFGAPT